ncbi:MAG: M28 family peptidase, partial [Candidatus Latescibacteria bacterium]|nr:M28 family peptidase [Candidatus Latescibacterota bacterium]
MKRQVFLLTLPCLAVWFSTLLLPSSNLQAQQGVPDAARVGFEAISAQNLRAVLTYLAGPEFKGRGNGTESLQMAGAYITSEFARAGLKPAGDDTSYFQHFRIYTVRPASNGNALVVKQGGVTRTLVANADFLSAQVSANASADGGLVFVGYGISAPELGYDDYAARKGEWVSGRIAVVLGGEPQEKDPKSVFEGLAGTDYARIDTKARNAQAHGAVGLIVITKTKDRDEALHDVLTVPTGYRPDAITREKPMMLLTAPDPITIPVVTLRADVSQTLLKDELGKVRPSAEIEQEIDRTLKPVTFPLSGTTATLSVNLERDVIPTRNVIGLLEGTDPQLKNEYLVIGAHYDHDGEGRGQIWAGADDDGSGTTGLIELVRAFTTNPIRPKRSILFAAWSAEEKGLLGSYSYTYNPRRPLDQTVAMLQMDMIGRNEDHPATPNSDYTEEKDEVNGNMLNIVGSKFSDDLGRIVREQNRAVGLDLKYRYDFGVQNLNRRSDQYPFLKKGIPAIFYFTGLHPDYHTPRDTPDKINYPKMEKVVRLVYLTAWDVANSETRPRYQRPTNTTTEVLVPPKPA